MLERNVCTNLGGDGYTVTWTFLDHPAFVHVFIFLHFYIVSWVFEVTLA